MVYTRSMKKKSAEAKANSQTYSNLPIDLTLEILRDLSLKDNIRASAVCKTWHEICVSVRVEDPTPWVMFLPLDKEEYELYDPSHGKTHFCKFPELRGSHIRHSKDGWLLMHDSFGNNNTFFFNPFTHERIQVAWPHLYLSDAVAFSCAPTSSSCVIFSVCDITNTLITIGTYRPAIRERTTSFFPNKLPLGHRGFEHVVYSNGVFYCLTYTGSLGMFDLSKSSWNLLPRQPPKRLETSPRFLTEYQGDIYLVYSHGHQKPTYLRLDIANRKWTEKMRLPGLTFYLGFQSAVTTNRDLVDTPKVNQNCMSNIWIKPPINVSNLFKS